MFKSTMCHANSQIVHMCELPFKLGCYRPDILLTETAKAGLICEINARFPLNGYLLSYAGNKGTYCEQSLSCGHEDRHTQTDIQTRRQSDTQGTQTHTHTHTHTH